MQELRRGIEGGDILRSRAKLHAGQAWLDQRLEKDPAARRKMAAEA